MRNRYINYNEQLQPLLRTRSNQPIVLKTVKKLTATKNANLIPYFLCTYFLMFAAAIGVVALLATLFFVSPLVVIDRSQNIHLLQYASATGRKILQRQFSATLLSAFLLSTVRVEALADIDLHNNTNSLQILRSFAILKIHCCAKGGHAMQKEQSGRHPGKEG